MTEKFEPKKENLSEHQKEILGNVGVESIKELEELVADLDPDSDEAKYFQEVLKQIKE